MGWGILAVFIQMKVSGERFDMPDDARVLNVIVTLAAVSICTAYFLKYLGVIWREVAIGTILFSGACCDVLRGEVLGIGCFVSLCVIFMGVVFFVVASLDEAEVKEKLAESKIEEGRLREPEITPQE